MFGTPFRRSAVLLAALPMALATAPAASAEDAPFCRTALVTTTTGLQVAYGVSGSRLNVCVVDATAGGLLVSVNTAARQITPPTVSRTTGLCPSAAVTVTYPVEASVAVTGGGVCVSLNGIATTVTFGDLGYDPDPQVWRAGNGGLIDVAFCLEEYVEYQTQPWAPDRWTPCGYTPARIL
ncbi:MAG TPA: hypothetical protein VNQ77_06935 [Frankiaceae bacterium]|nr:hypothetical protein [Frankiaceae bacterium]